MTECLVPESPASLDASSPSPSPSADGKRRKAEGDVIIDLGAGIPISRRRRFPGPRVDAWAIKDARRATRRTKGFLSCRAAAASFSRCCPGVRPVNVRHIVVSTVLQASLSMRAFTLFGSRHVRRDSGARRGCRYPARSGHLAARSPCDYTPAIPGWILKASVKDLEKRMLPGASVLFSSLCLTL